MKIRFDDEIRPSTLMINYLLKYQLNREIYCCNFALKTSKIQKVRRYTSASLI